MLLLSARWPRPLGGRKISKWTKIWGILLGHALFAGGIWEEDILTAEIEEFKKIGCIRNISQKSECERSPVNPKEMKNLYFLWQMVQQNYQEETSNSKNQLWDGNPPWGERISAENLMAIGKSFNLKKQKMSKESMRNFGLTQKLGKTYRHHIELRNSIARTEKRIIPYFQDLHYWRKLLREERYDAGGGLEKSQNIWGKNKSNCIDITGKRRNSAPY